MVPAPAVEHRPQAGPALVPSWGVAARVGPRRHHADAAAGHHGARSGRTAVAVADGVGDSSAAAFAATVVADHAVRVAALEGDPAAGVVAAGDLLRSAGDLVEGDAALVVALAPAPGDEHWTVAWVGDCRAYTWRESTLTAVTRDHTVAEQMRAGGVAVRGRWEHVLSTSVRTARPEEVGVVRPAGPSPGALVLVSDGVHRVVPPRRAAAVLGASAGYATPTDRAEWLLDAAEEAGLTDNATALVVEAAVRPVRPVRPRSAPTIPVPRRPGHDSMRSA